MCEEVSAHEAGEAGLEPVHGEGGGVVERMHGDEDWAGGQLVLPAGQPVHGGEGVTLTQPVSVNLPLTGADGQAGHDFLQLPLDSVNMDLEQKKPLSV